MRTALRIINFHGIGRPKRSLEPGEAAYWLSHQRFNEMLDRINSHPDRDMLRITFDDSNASDLDLAIPELNCRALTAEFFVLTNRIGQFGSLGAGDIRALLKAGMGVGSHGVAHRDWSSLDRSALDHELRASKRELEDICRGPIKSTSVPFGRYNAHVLRRIRAAGYGTAYSSDKGTAYASAFLQHRSSVRSDTTDDMVDAICSGRMSTLARLRRTVGIQMKTWA
jgi:peptidoglycan/xylan/chitin deacetylase (PgdA/CDA1 family)